MAMDKIAKISLAFSLVEHIFFLGIVGVVVSIPAAKVIPLIEINLMNTRAFNDMLSSPLSSGRGKNATPEKNSVSPNITVPDPGKLLPPSEVGSTMEGSLTSTLDIVGSGVAENVRFSGGKISGFTFTGTGIVTAKPDNVFIQFMIKSGPMVTLRAAEIESGRKVDFLTYNLGRLFKIKKESFKSYGFHPEIIQQTMRQAKTLKRRDDDGNVIERVQQRYNITKYVVVNDLKNKKFEDICEILDKAIDYGAVAIANIPKEAASDTSSGDKDTQNKKDSGSSSQTSKVQPGDNSVSSEKPLGAGDTKMSAVEGASKLKFKSDTKNPSNQMINYHFNEVTLGNLIKGAKDEAYKEAKDKVARIKAVLKFKESEMDIGFEEDIGITSDEEGAVTIKVDVTAALEKPKVTLYQYKPEENADKGKKNTFPAGKKGASDSEE